MTHPDAPGRLGHRQPSALQELLEPVGQVLPECSALGEVGGPSEREHRPVDRGHDVDAEPWTPQLHERLVLPGVGPHVLHPSVEAEQRGPGHAVGQAGPGHLTQGRPAHGKTLIERGHSPAVGEDLLPGDRQSCCHQRDVSRSGA